MAALFIALAVGCLLAALAAMIADLERVERTWECRGCGSWEPDGADLCAECFAVAWGVEA